MRLRALSTAASLALVTLVVSACGEQVRPCGLDGACPPKTVCVEGLCQNAPWWTDTSRFAADAGAGTCETTKAAPQLPPRAGTAGGWLGGRLFLVGGDPKAGGRCGGPGLATALATSWKPCVGWAVHTGQLPAARANAASAPGLGSVWIFGGRRRGAVGGAWTLYGDLWRLSGEPAVWTPGTTAKMPPRHSAGLAIQTDPPSVWVFGGDAGTTDGVVVPLSDLRRYRIDHGAWEGVAQKNAPPSARAGHAMVALDEGAALLIFGGRGAGGLLADTWRYDTAKATWSQLSAGAAPSPRERAQMAVSGGHVWLFGGADASPQGVRNDLWRRPAKGAGGWTRVFAGDLGAEARVGGLLTTGNDPCALPSGMVSLDTASPPRRRAGLLVAGEGALWLAGGRGECGPLGDIWRFDPAVLTWSLVAEDPRGWSCARAGRSCQGWCE